MREVLSAAGRAFLREFGGALLVLIPGILAAPDFTAGKALSVGALIAAIGAGIRAVQEFVPQLSISAWLVAFAAKSGRLANAAWVATVGAVADTALRAFVGGVLTFVPGLLAAPDFGTAKALAAAGIVAAGAAAVRAVTAFFTSPNTPPPVVAVRHRPAV